MTICTELGSMRCRDFSLCFPLLVCTFFFIHILGLQESRGSTWPEGQGSPVMEKDSLPSDDFIHVYGGLDNFFFRVKKEKKATVAFLGGSITAGPGWRDKVMKHLQDKYPETTWTFHNAGIPSLGSLPHAYRLQNDVLSQGPVDLLFVESAVNDLANGTPVSIQRRSLEGIVRHAWRENPAVCIVMMAFADELKVADYKKGIIPVEVRVHDEVASHYKLAFINLAKEVAMRIDANEFTWKDDFKDLHPSPFGHDIYFRSIKRLLSVTEQRFSRKLLKHKLPVPLDQFNYSRADYVSVERAKNLRGFAVDPAWKPLDSAKTRKRFVNIPMLVSTKPESSFEFSFRGNGVGISVISGPDAGTVRYSVDGGKEQTKDLFTQWSASLHLPWFVMLGDELNEGDHTLRVTLLDAHNPKATGSSCRIAHFLVNSRSVD